MRVRRGLDKEGGGAPSSKLRGEGGEEVSQELKGRRIVPFSSFFQTPAGSLNMHCISTSLCQSIYIHKHIRLYTLHDMV